MKQLAPSDLTELENMIDRTSLRAVLLALRDIAGEKADHIDTNWGDCWLAGRWNAASVAVGNCADRPAVVNASQD